MYPAPSLHTNKFNFSNVSSGVSGGSAAVLTEAEDPGSDTSRPAAARMAFVGPLQPSSLWLPSASGGVKGCDIAGNWTQVTGGGHRELFHIKLGRELPDGTTQFNLTHSSTDTQRDGWTFANGTLDAARSSFKFAYFRPGWAPGQHGWVEESGSFAYDCDHTSVSDSTWTRVGAPPPPPDPSTASPVAKFEQLVVAANASSAVTIQVINVIAASAAGGYLFVSRARVVPADWIVPRSAHR